MVGGVRVHKEGTGGEDSVSFLSLSILVQEDSEVHLHKCTVTWEYTLSGLCIILTFIYLVSRGGSSNCGSGVSSTLSAKTGTENLAIDSVPSTPQSEVLKLRFSEYPPRWPVFHRGEVAFMGLTQGLRTARLASILSRFSTIDWGTLALYCSAWQGTIESNKRVKWKWLWKRKCMLCVVASSYSWNRWLNCPVIKGNTIILYWYFSLNYSKHTTLFQSLEQLAPSNSLWRLFSVIFYIFCPYEQQNWGIAPVNKDIMIKTSSVESGLATNLF